MSTQKICLGGKIDFNSCCRVVDDGRELFLTLAHTHNIIRQKCKMKIETFSFNSNWSVCLCMAFHIPHNEEEECLQAIEIYQIPKQS